MLKTGVDGRSFPEIGGVMNHLHLLGLELIHDRLGAIGRGVIDNDDLEVTRDRFLHLLNYSPDRAAFVVARDDDRKNHGAALEVAGLVPESPARRIKSHPVARARLALARF